MTTDPRKFLSDLFREALQAVEPARCCAPAIPAPGNGRTVVVGAGKAAAAMAQALEAQFKTPVEGVVVVPDGHEAKCEHIRVMVASHPVPDARGFAASQAILAAVAGLSESDQVVCLLSGGGSSSLCMPGAGVTLAHKQALSKLLLMAGADIGEINCVRKHLSAVKGGRLAMACYPARCITLAISDVPGNDPALIASGPTYPDPTRSSDALAVLKKYRLPVDNVVVQWLGQPASESPEPGEAQFARCQMRVIASGTEALAAAEKYALQQDVEVLNEGAALDGPARVLAARHARWALEARVAAADGKPRLLISGGETTVAVTGSGRGGRNTEYLLALAETLDGEAGIFALACDTDGIDGSSGAAGALYDPGLARRWRARGLQPSDFLAANDSAGFFSELDALIHTGPTLTNVNDFRALLVVPLEQVPTEASL